MRRDVILEPSLRTGQFALGLVGLSESQQGAGRENDPNDRSHGRAVHQVEEWIQDLGSRGPVPHGREGPAQLQAAPVLFFNG